ncbi:low molecular weight phosphatase family protein [Nesterenkonia sp. E16_7]|uniref:arsenate reductase/protein-tyrosine-phosphatase family protein n=1 Tax=unclassified Nesterenkonia TaxID=2629769 RepID=UPI001A922619|nr:MULTISPECIES: low molecular weight phosphatase family protein [unclassified Nesterenkonia]MBO0594104.1 low molecular weight phosphatase family protein [Nesterenkonia sp. E16_10]MBO0597550.1 low molecular weight phosphatase family protein [Nesterenkonia sp. E16_7]
MTETYTLLAVCTGNICRSPAMDRLLAHELGSEPGITVGSAGTHAHVGDDMEAQMKDRLVEYGADTENFEAQQLEPALVRSADLVLTATRGHVRDILADVPESGQKVFTLREFVRLLDSLDPTARAEALESSQTVAGKLAALLPLVADQRDQTQSPTAQDDVVDPYMMPEDVFDESFAQVREPITTLRETLRG